MKKLKINIIYIISFILVLSSCVDTELDYREDPNGASPSDADVALLLNGAMVNFVNFNESVTNAGMQVTRMTHMFGPVYANAYSPQNFNGIWSNAYAGVMADAQVIINNGIESQLFEHVAVAKIMQSYVLTTLVDMFGDVPYSEAIQFTGNLNPKLDSGEDIYNAALAMLDEAIAHFGETSVKSLTGADDIFFGGSVAKWTTLAKTLKLRIYNNTRLNGNNAAQINALITEGDIILDSDDEFEIAYGTQLNDPDVRHYKFTQSYLGDGGEYMSTYFMGLMKDGQSIPDPRLRYYFYRQVLSYPDPTTAEGLFTMPCLGKTKPTHYGFDDPFCNVGEGYWGRDHGDDDGGPPDGNSITVWGLYPAGGKFDNDNGQQAGPNDGAKGAGIHPIWNVAATKFLLAESALMSGTNGDPATLLEEGIRASIDKVTNFNTSSIPAGAATPTPANIDTYVDEVVAEFNAANQDEKLNIIMKQAFISHWGNGIEVYNGYRRTSKPDNLQPTITASPGNYIRSFVYPSDLVTLNSNVDAKGVEVKVFWDKNPDNLN